MIDNALAEAVQFAPLIERVHGAGHPELTRVRELTMELNDSDDADRISEIFTELRSVTNNHTLPEDACEAYEATYKALEKADALHSKA